MFERGSDRRVTVALSLPIEVAEYLRDHGPTLLRLVENALRDYELDPPPDVAAEHAAERAQQRMERARWLKSVGRIGARHLRACAVDPVTAATMPKAGTRVTWQRRQLMDLSQLLCIDFNELRYATDDFRRDFRTRFEYRRRREWLRLASDGASNVAITKRYKVSIPTVVRHLRRAVVERRQRETSNA